MQRSLLFSAFFFFPVQYSLACRRQGVFLMGTVTSFWSKEEKHGEVEKMDETASSRYEKVSDK